MMGVMKPLALIGYRGAGKSTAAKAIARHTGWEVIHLDQVIESHARRSIADWVEEAGWGPFRTMERQWLADILNGRGDHRFILDCGGGIIEEAANRNLLRAQSVVVWLDCDERQLIDRLAASPKRPSLTGKSHAEEIREVLARRNPLYRETAHATVSADTLDAGMLAARVWEAYTALEPAARGAWKD